MQINEEEKRLTNTHEGIFNKIRNFFRRAFSKAEVQDNKDMAEQNENNQFRENIQIKQDEEKRRILELQQDFKKGNIEESEIEENDYNKLIKLYDEQNEKLRQEIEMYKKETAKILQQMKNE